jgi:hypothetical protein
MLDGLERKLASRGLLGEPSGQITANPRKQYLVPKHTEDHALRLISQQRSEYSPFATRSNVSIEVPTGSIAALLVHPRYRDAPRHG